MCIVANSRVDKGTLQYKEFTEENGGKNSRKEKRHITFNREINIECKSFIHRVIPDTNAACFVLVEDVASVLEEFNCVNIKTLLVDNTRTNTRLDAGLVTKRKKKP